MSGTRRPAGERRTTPAHARDPAYVQSLARGLAVVRALGRPDPQTLSDVARSTGLPRAAARRFLLTLARLGYVAERDGRFTLTPQVLDLGHAYLSSLTLPDVAHPHLTRLVEQVQESSSVSVLDGDDVVYVARVQSRRIMTVAIAVGTRFPAHATSMGRVLLADLEPGARPTGAPEPLTITTHEALERQLDLVSRQGYAIVDQELEVGLRSIAVPIRARSGTVTAAINLSVSAATMTIARMRTTLLAPLRTTAEAIERDLARLTA